MNNRPKIRLELSLVDKVIEIAGSVLLCATWGLVAVCYSGLPDIIPIHYNASGIADGFESKENLLILPVISSVLFIGMTVLNRFPHIFNYPVNITEDNALIHYLNMTRMLRILKLVIVLIFGMLVFKAINQTDDTTNELGRWFVITTILLIFIPLVFYFTKSFLHR